MTSSVGIGKEIYYYSQMETASLTGWLILKLILIWTHNLLNEEQA